MGEEKDYVNDRGDKNPNGVKENPYPKRLLTWGLTLETIHHETVNRYTDRDEGCTCCCDGTLGHFVEFDVDVMHYYNL
jgi:hypothetical protein